MKEKFILLFVLSLIITFLGSCEEPTNSAGFEGWGHNAVSQKVSTTFLDTYADASNTNATTSSGGSVPIDNYYDMSDDDRGNNEVTAQKGVDVVWVNDLKEMKITAKSTYTINFITDNDVPESVITISEDSKSLSINMELLFNYGDDFKEFGEELGFIEFKDGTGKVVKAYGIVI